MLMDKNKSISPIWELNSFAKRKIKIVLFCPQTWLPCHVTKPCTEEVSKQEASEMTHRWPPLNGCKPTIIYRQPVNTGTVYRCIS